MDELKIGNLVGTDKYGNKYYENPRFFYGRNRWVEYAPYYRKLSIIFKGKVFKLDFRFGIRC